MDGIGCTSGFCCPVCASGYLYSGYVSDTFCTLPANSLANIVVICKGVFSSFSEFVWISGLPLFSTLQLSTSNF
ncbi:hypothetical protein D9758_000012 [Tetrapyrgos nigripes]|uniref:Uncharacterized protein n=1 Tax=Tetrapyrgos nigripes TaxID=182062 RepID=A0A8H5H1K4_9AGAR|nr:hypothetical protein D9758_000012 [Tetrapyrgos nigripes]